VIQGAERFSKDKGKEENKMAEKEAGITDKEAGITGMETEMPATQPSFLEEEEEEPQPKIREPKRQKSNGFLKRIQDWFEGDEI
jgi:hypothetical protein